ncbi:MAG: tRNA (N6-isopentenyl adenosine(37)-C2)-methylthiotransferase MiaB [Ruminococcaceae bacterium]|nr:tRNA (N6-isopentenyl adenosine(37)-C2)-methylthiotransferase MiaB [Oscillospiraceae bacterium]
MKRKNIEISREELDRQLEIIARVRDINSARSDQPLAFVDTYGCQQNEADSEKLRGMLSEMGYGFTRSEKEADVIVINTCAVREHAEMRVFGNIGALTHTKRAKPDQIIALCGCMAQRPGVAERVKRSFRHVDLVFGPHVLWQFPQFLYEILSKRKRIFSTEDSDGVIAEGIPALRDGGVKAWLSIMYGCNNFCSYCIVPYVRGRERSRRPELIIEDAKKLIADGAKDITLLGQNVNSYGKDLEENIDFSEIIKRVNDLEGDFLIRFMTSHPKDAGDKLFETIANCEKAAHHIHLPFQAGNDRILKVMNRHYNREEYLRLIESARRYIPDVVLTSDVIVGFPGETDEEFEDTLSLIEQVRFDSLFTFIYSPRPGTPAAEMPDPFTREQKQVRFDKLLDLQNRISSEKHASYVGSTRRVLVDGLTNDEIYPLSSRTNGGRLVHLSGDKSLVGSYVDAEIIDSNTWALYGKCR